MPRSRPHFVGPPDGFSSVCQGHVVDQHQLCAGAKRFVQLLRGCRPRPRASGPPSLAAPRTEAASTAALTPPRAAMWLSFTSMASDRLIRWLLPPPQRTAYFSAARRPGRVLRVSLTTAPVPATASTKAGRHGGDPRQVGEDVEDRPLGRQERVGRTAQFAEGRLGLHPGAARRSPAVHGAPPVPNRSLTSSSTSCTATSPAMVPAAWGLWMRWPAAARPPHPSGRRREDPLRPPGPPFPAGPPKEGRASSNRCGSLARPRPRAVPSTAQVPIAISPSATVGRPVARCHWGSWTG